MASYNWNTGPSVSSVSEFSIKAKGYSWSMRHNFKDWSEYTRTVKKRMARVMRNRVAKAAVAIAEEAIARCPHYSGALEEAIRVADPEITSVSARAKIEMYVGVLSTWHSSYDAVAAKYGYIYSSDEVLSRLHELYDTFIYSTKWGIKRKERKEAISGERVGSGFLLRAYTENRDMLRDLMAAKVDMYDTSAMVSASESEMNDYLTGVSDRYGDDYEGDGTDWDEIYGI